MDVHAVVAALAGVDTPTVCNALIALDPSLKGKNYTLDSVVPADTTMPSFTGYALTAKINSSEAPLDDDATLLARRFAYYRYLEAARKPALVVMQDCGTRRGYGSFWGEINVAVHKALGLRGAVTDGAIRDLGSLGNDFHLIGGNVCPGSGFGHLVDFDTSVSVFGLPVNPGDLVHADRHGCVVVPSQLAADLPAAIANLLKREQTFLAKVRVPALDSDTLIAAWLDFQNRR